MIPDIATQPAGAAVDWRALFDAARATPAWTEMLDRGRRARIRHTRGETRTPAQWSIRDLAVDLGADVLDRLRQAGAPPAVVTVYGDVVRVPADASLTLDGTALLIVARRIEVDGPASIRLDYRTKRSARLLLYADEVGGDLVAQAVLGARDVRRLPVPPPPASAAGVRVRYADGEPRVESIPGMPPEWFQGDTPLWRSATAAFQVAAVLMATSPDEAARMLAHIARSADHAPAQAAFAAEWRELARASRRLQADGPAGAAVWGTDYGRQLFRGTGAAERRRRADELERADAAKVATSYHELVKNGAPPPAPEHPRYVRYGSEPLGLATLNGDERPVRRVTLSGAEIVLDDVDGSRFLRTFADQKDVQELVVHADTLVIRTALRLPQTHVTIHCRDLYFEGADARIDTSPVGRGIRSPTVLDGADGDPGGDITLHIRRFGTTETGAVHFRTCGGRGQDPDDGGYGPSSARHLRPLVEADWKELFAFSNRRVGTGTFDTPEWSRFAADRIVYAELVVDGKVVASKGLKAEPGTGGAGLMGGRPGTGGAGGALRSTVDEVLAHADLGGGVSGSPHGPSKGGAGGSPTEAVWLTFENEVRNGVLVLKETREVRKAARGPDGPSGPEAAVPRGTDGVFELLETAHAGSWRTAVNTGVAVQVARDALAAGHPADAREFLVPYLPQVDPLAGIPDDGAPIPAGSADGAAAAAQLARQAADLADQALRNVDDFGNPPGWVPMLSLESAVDVYERILRSSMQELYSAYVLQRSWAAKADRQATLEDLARQLSSQTESVRDELKETRRGVMPLMRELQQLMGEIEETGTKLQSVQQQLERQNDRDAVDAERKAQVAAAFKIMGAIVKAIPLPEPYQAAAAGIGTIFDATGNFVDDAGGAFKTLKDQIGTFSAENSESLANVANAELETALRRSQEDVVKLKDAAKKAGAEAEALAKEHGDKAEAYEKALEAEKKLYEIKKEALIYGRTADDKQKLVKEAEALQKGFASWEAQQKAALDDETREYLAKKEAVAGKQAGIERKEKALALRKAEVDKQKKASEASIKKGLKKVQAMVDGVETIYKTVDGLRVPAAKMNTEWNKALATLQSSSPEFQAITGQLGYLNQRKVQLTTQLAKVKTELAEQKNQIGTNLVATHELSMQIASLADTLDPQVVVYAQALGQDAHRDLQEFLYYVVKAYEYLRVEPWGTPHHGAQKLFDDMRNVLEPSDFKYAFVDDADGEAKRERLWKLLAEPSPEKQGRLSPDEFDLLRVVYEKPLRDMGKQLLRELMTASSATEAPFSITLREDRLQELNDRVARGEAASVPFDLTRLRQVDRSKERQRIADIRVTRVRCRRLGANLPDRLTFRFTLRGKSLVRAGGGIFAFEPEGPKASDARAAATVSFETFGGNTDGDGWRADERGDLLEGKALWQPTARSQQNLIAKLLGDDPTNQPALTLSGFRPGSLSDFTLSMEINPPEAKVELLELQLLVTVEGTDAPADEWIVLATSNVPGMSVPFTTSQPDRAGHSGGLGQYVGVFRGPKSVGISVPAVVDNYRLEGWQHDGQQVAGTNTSIELTRSAYVVALYAPVPTKPVS